MSKTTIRKRANKFKNQDITAASNRKGGAVPFLLMIPAGIFLLLFTLIPLINLTIGSMHDLGSDLNPFYKVAHDSEWWDSVIFSFSYATLTLIASLSLSLLISASLASMVRKRFRGFWQTLFFIPYVTSIVAMSVVFAAIFDQTGGIFNKLFGITKPWLYTRPGEGTLTLITIWIFGVWQSMAFQILILVSAMLAIDKRLYDAADIDGVSKSRQFISITMPQLKTVINYLILIGLITSIKSFTMALYDNNMDTAIRYAPTMLLYIYRYTVNGVDLAGAASVFMIILVILFQFVVTTSLSLIEKLYKKTSKANVNRKLKRFEENIMIQEVTTEFLIGGDK